MTFFTLWNRHLGVRYGMLIVIMLPLSLTVGCGPSQQELMMRQAQRVRDDREIEPLTAKQVKQTKPPPAKDPEPAPEPDVKEPEIVQEPAELSQEDGEELVVEGLVPIEERKPAEPLSAEARRQKAYDNLLAVSKGLLDHAKDRGNLPRAYVTANGFKTLSWRVELLPYLGYEQLYKKFDPNVPWNKPPNDALLKFIPDEYVSPERFDVETNIAIPSNKSFIGDPALRGARVEDTVIEDGVENTLLLVETKESRPWTAPWDFEPAAPEDARLGLLGLREDGAFAVWANGWPVLLASGLDEQIFWDAMTVASGGGLRAGNVHRDIPLKQSEAAVAADTKEPDPATPIETAIPDDARPVAVPANIREQVPIAADVADAQIKLRKVFAKKISSATTDAKKRALSAEMLDLAAQMSDSAEAFALQTAAMRMAIDGGGCQELIAAIDHRVRRFEVDAYEENIVQLLAFGAENNTRKPESIEAEGFLERSAHVVYSAIIDNDFIRASSLLQIAYRYLDQGPGEELPKNVNRLRAQLGNAQRYYERTRYHLAAYRENPNDGEAAAVVGRFLCFIKGDWEAGLPLLAKGGPDTLRELARADLEGAKDYLDKVAMGDSWWNLSSQATVGVFRTSARDRALHWYQQVYRTMPQSLDRMHVKARIDEAEEEEAGSPLELLRRLAQRVNIDLTISLASIADVGQRRNIDED